MAVVVITAVEEEVRRSSLGSNNSTNVDRT